MPVILFTAVIQIIQLWVFKVFDNTTLYLNKNVLLSEKETGIYGTGKQVNPVSKMMSHSMQNRNHAKKLVVFVKKNMFFFGYHSAYVARIGKNVTTVSPFTVL